jgi:hypothetical protein
VVQHRVESRADRFFVDLERQRCGGTYAIDCGIPDFDTARCFRRFEGNSGDGHDRFEGKLHIGRFPFEDALHYPARAHINESEPAQVPDAMHPALYGYGSHHMFGDPGAEHTDQVRRMSRHEKHSLIFNLMLRKAKLLSSSPSSMYITS